MTTWEEDVHFVALKKEGTDEFIREMDRVEPENTEHLFWECESVKTVIINIFRITCGEPAGNVDKGKFMCGWEDVSRKFTRIGLYLVHFVKFYIYKCRNWKRLPLTYHLIDKFEYAAMGLARNRTWREGLQQVVHVLESNWA